MKTLRFLFAFIACAAGLHGAGTPTFDTVNGVAIAGGANTITLGKGTTTITLNTTGTIGSAAFTAASAYAPAAGSTSILTLGTIGTGTWQGSIIAPAYLGTGTGITTKYLRGDGTWQTVDTGLTVSATALAGGTSGRVLYNNAGILGEMTTSGSGTTLALTTSPTFVTPDLGTPSALVGTNITGTAAGLTAGNVTTIPALSGAITNTGNATVLGSFTMAQLNTAVSDADVARTSGTNTFTGVQSMTSPDITTSITTPSTTFTAFAGATTLATIGGTGATAVVAIPGTLDASNSTTGSVTMAGGLAVAKKLHLGDSFVVTKSQAASTTCEITNTNTTNGAAAALHLTNNAGVAYVFTASSNTAAGFEAGKNRLAIDSGTTLGVSLTGRGAAATIEFYTAGPATANRRGIMSAAGGFSWGSATDPGAGNVLFGGTLAVTGNTTLNAALITTPEALAPALNAGAACGVTTVASGFALNGVNALTLANGTNGQIKTIVCTAVTAAGTATLTPTTCSGFTTVAFTAAGQTLTLQYFTTGGWVILSVRGATPS